MAQLSWLPRLDTHIVELLLAHGADINEIGVQGPPGDLCFEDMGSPLHTAIIQGHEDLALFLIDAGADSDLKDGQERTPKHLALQNNQTRVLDHPRGRRLSNS